MDDSVSWEVHPAIDSMPPERISDQFIPLALGYEWTYSSRILTDVGIPFPYFFVRSITSLSISGKDTSYEFSDYDVDDPYQMRHPAFSERIDSLGLRRTFRYSQTTMTILKFPLIEGSRWRAVQSDTLNIHEWGYFGIRAMDTALTIGSRKYDHAVMVESSNQQYFPHKRFVIVPGIGIVFEQEESGLAAETIKLEGWKF